MVKIDLITGFLGSGKTTFIKKYAKYLMAQGMNIGILENDFGAVNVDMMLLKDLTLRRNRQKKPLKRWLCISPPPAIQRPLRKKSLG